MGYRGYSVAANDPITAEHIQHALSEYAEQFIRDPGEFVYTKKSKDPRKHIRELTRFVFARYRVPDHLQNVWDKRFQTAQLLNTANPLNRPVLETGIINKIDWYICAAQGGSLYKEHAKAHLTKKETHTFLTCPHELTFDEAITFSIAKTFAETDGIALRIAKSKIRGTGEFTKSVIYFFARNPADSINEINDLYDFIRDQRVRNANFTMAGFTLDSLRKRTKDWHYALRREKVMGDSKWAPAPIEDFKYEEKVEGQNVAWHVVQITTAKELSAEGTAQHHCVSSYKPQCVAGHTYIFSLRREDNNGAARKVTIELRNDGTIVQARGKANRKTTHAEHHIISRWAAANDLRLSYYR